MKKEILEGLIAAPFTPMDENGNINLDPITEYVDLLVESGVKGAFLCGTTGESPSLTLSEKKTVIEEWVNCTDNRLKIIAHVGGNSLSENIELAVYAKEAGVDAIASMSPFFFKPNTVENLLHFLEPMAKAASDIPFYYYHIPSMTGFDLPVHQILEGAVKRIPNFTGVKFTHFDLMDLQQCLEIDGDRFEILFGSDEILLSALSLGITSAVGSTYNYMAPVYLNLISAFEKGDFKSARELQQYSVKVVEILNKHGNPMSAGKAIMSFVGVDCGPCRLPLEKLSTEEKNSLKNDLDGIGFFELVNSKVVEG